MPARPPDDASQGPLMAPMFAIGLALGLAHLPLSLEMGLSLTHYGSLVRSLVMFLYPVALAFVGIGAAIDQLWVRGREAGPPLRLSGVSMLVLLAVSLRLNFFVSSMAGLWLAACAHLLGLGAWFGLLGATISRLLRAGHGSGRAGTAWAVHLAGLVLGYALSDPLVTAVGANAILLAVGLALLAPRIEVVSLTALLVVGAAVPLDERIEDLRDTLAWQTGDLVSERAEADQGIAVSRAVQAGPHEVLLREWSRFSLIHLLDTPENGVVGIYNLYLQWIVASPTAPAGAGGLSSEVGLRSRVYQLLPSDGRIAILGIGGGRGLQELSFYPHKDVVVVERDRSVARYFSRTNPASNLGVMAAATTLSGDGRAAMERAAPGFDAIVVESARFQPAHSMLPASAPLYLYTREAIETYIRHLSPTGLFLASMNHVRTAYLSFLPAQVLRSLDDLGVEYVTFQEDEHQHVHILACLQPGCASYYQQRVAELVPSGITFGWEPPQSLPTGRYQLRDDTPFAAWAMMQPDARSTLMTTAVLMGLAVLAAGGAVSLKTRRRACWNPGPYFFLIGLGYAVATLATFHAYRTYYGDGILTILRLVIWFALFGAIGSHFSPQIKAWLLPTRGRSMLATLALGALHACLLQVLPFETGRTWIVEIVGALVVLPGAVFMGALFPLGIQAGDEGQVSWSLLADAIGTLGGYAALYLVLLPLGNAAFGALALVCYLGAVATWRFR